MNQILSLAEHKIKYNREARTWECWPDDCDYEHALIIGAVDLFPAGREGQRAATLAALTHDCPEVAAWIDATIQGHPDNPAFIDRLLRAGLLIRDGAVLSVEAGRNGNPDYIAARVRSSHGGREYHVYHNLTWSCDCADFDDGKAALAGHRRDTYAPHVAGLGVCCKHVLAVWLSARLQPDDDEPEPAAPGEVLYDLVIASKKHGYGSTSNAAAPIVWWKLAGRERETPPRPCSLVDDAIQRKLAGYELVATEVHPNAIIRKYRRGTEAQRQADLYRLNPVTRMALDPGSPEPWPEEEEEPLDDDEWHELQELRREQADNQVF